MENAIKNIHEKVLVQRGEIWYADLGSGIGSEQQGKRPVCIISNNVGLTRSSIASVIPITSKTKRLLPTHVSISGSSTGLPLESTLLLEQLTTIDQRRLIGKIGVCPEKTLIAIDRAVKVSLAMKEIETKNVNTYNKDNVIERERFDKTRVVDISESINKLEVFCNEHESIDLRDIKDSIKTHLYEMKKYCNDYGVSWKFLYHSKLITKSTELISNVG